MLLAVGCATPSKHEAPPPLDSALAFPNVLLHEGAPAAAEDWSFAPFSDQGAWFGFALPPADETDLRGGFAGPFLMTSGRWIGPQLTGLVLAEAGSTIMLDGAQDVVRLALPGRLRQTLTADGLELTQELWFDSSSTALVRWDLRNSGTATRSMELAWTGSVFADQATLERADSGVIARAGGGTSIRVDPDRRTSGAVVEGLHYTLRLADPVELAPNRTVSVAVAVTLLFEGDTAYDEQTVARAPAEHETSFTRNRERWNGYLAAIDTGTASTDPRQILAVKSLNTLVNNWRGPAGRLRYSGLFPSSNVGYFNGFWAWDSWKHAVALVRFDAELAKDQVRSMFDHQDETGMVADVVYLDPAEDNWRDTKPPLAGWAVEAIFDATGDTTFVGEIYPKLVAYHEFWYAHRDHDGDGLCEYGSTDGTVVAARWESGMDNAVRFDSTQMLQNGPRAWSMNQESVDLNSYLYREKRALQRLAEALELPEDTRRWTEQADSLRRRIQQTMYDDDTGWFYDVNIDAHSVVPVQGPEGWTPLWAGVATDDQASRIRETLLDPGKFRTHVPFPTVARDDPGFSDGYWRGLVWLDQAYFAIEGLRRYGYDEDANELTRQLLESLEGATVPGAALRENYSPLTGKGQNAKHFSWTAAHLLLLSLDADRP